MNESDENITIDSKDTLQLNTEAYKARHTRLLSDQGILEQQEERKIKVWEQTIKNRYGKSSIIN
jgi:hypothetical protein